MLKTGCKVVVVVLPIKLFMTIDLLKDALKKHV